MDLEVREIPIQSRGMYNSRLKSYKQEMEKLEKDFKERVRWREKDGSGEVKKDKKKKKLFSVQGSVNHMEARFIPHCTPEESAVMGAGPALPALAVSLPTGSSLLISPLLPSRGLLYQCPHRPRSQPSINKRSRIAYSDEVRNDLLGDDGSSSESQRAHLLDNTEKLERSSRRLEAGYQIAVETEQVGQEILTNLHSDREKIQRSRDRLRETDANLGKSSRILTGMLRRIIQNRILVFILGAIILLTIILAIYFNLRGH